MTDRFSTWDSMQSEISIEDVLHGGTDMKSSGCASGFYLYCWYNTLTLWQHTTEQITAYYGVAGTGTLIPHMWLSADGKSAIETTEQVETYRGVALNGKQAASIMLDLTQAEHGKRLFTDCYRLYQQRGIIRTNRQVTTKRLIERCNRKYDMLFHPVKAKEIEQEHGKGMNKKYIWKGVPAEQRRWRGE
jgi:hypothetical protein